MHTDEYEISIGREISLCRRISERLRNAIMDKEKKYGMTTEAFLQLQEQSQSAVQNRDFQSWRKDHLELKSWQQRLSEYEKALQMIKGI
jgi:hypothetical protein